MVEKYLVDMSPEGVLGSGSSSICRRAVMCQTGEAVAVKLYRHVEGCNRSVTQEDVELQFQRQVAVLHELQQAPQAVPSQRFFHPWVQESPASSFFIRVFDYSRSASGLPGSDAKDGSLWITTELAQYGLRHFLDVRKDMERPLRRDEVWSIAKAIILVVAALHARGLVHVDLKPENLMIFRGKLKLIDVDGCVPAGKSVCVAKTPISFSAYYCAPEWADLLVNCWQQAQDGTVTPEPSLDVWSVGMILCELVSLEPVMKGSYQQIAANAFTQRQAALLYMEWLAGIEALELPAELAQLDPEFAEVVSEALLLYSPEKRWTLAECLGHSSLVEASDMIWPPLSPPTGEKGPSPRAAVAPASITLDAKEFAAIQRFSLARHSTAMPPAPQAERESSCLSDSL